MKRLNEKDKSPPRPVVAFYAHKGGVGKTTSCLAMAVRASQKGLRVCLLDCDPQQNATAFLSQWQGEKRFDYEADYRAMAAQYRLDQIRTSELTKEQKAQQAQYALAHRNILDLLLLSTNDGYTNELRKQPCIGYPINDKLSVVAAHPMLSSYETLLAYEVALRQLAANHMARLTWLLRFLMDDRFDLVLLDLAPSNSLFNQMALVSCSHFIMPITGDRFALQSLETLDLMLAQMRDNFAYRLDENAPFENVRLPQLLCLLYTQYKPGDCLLPMERISQSVDGCSKLIHKVSEADGVRCMEIRNLFYDRAEQLHKFMDVARVVWQIVLVPRATELYRRLGHLNRTVFDAPLQHSPVTSPLELERLGQQQGYALLWECMHQQLFADRPEWV